jgi:hypothetical protein
VGSGGKVMEVWGIDLGLEATGIHSHDAGMTTRVRDGRVVTLEAIRPANVRREEGGIVD